MTIIDFFTGLPFPYKICVAVIAIYLLVWFFRIIGSLSRILKQLIKINDNLQEINSSVNEGMKSTAGARVTSELLAKMLINNKNDKEKN